MTEVLPSGAERMHALFGVEVERIFGEIRWGQGSIIAGKVSRSCCNKWLREAHAASVLGPFEKLGEGIDLVVVAAGREHQQLRQCHGELTHLRS